jgi:hypothetical protein
MANKNMSNNNIKATRDKRAMIFISAFLPRAPHAGHYAASN